MVKCQNEAPPCERDATHVLTLFDDVYYTCEECGQRLVDAETYNASMSALPKPKEVSDGNEADQG